MNRITETLPPPPPGRDVPAGVMPSVILGVKILLTVTCAVLNGACVTAIIKGRMYRKNMFMILLLLTLSDLLFGLVHMPLAMWVGQLGERVTGTPLCFVFTFSMRFFSAVSLLSTTLYNVDRFIAIQWPYIYLAHVNRKRIGLIWTGSVAMLLLGKLSLTLTAIKTIYIPGYEVCVDVAPEGPQHSYSRYIPEMLFAGACHLALVITSCVVVRTVNAHKRKIEQQDRISGSGIHVQDASTISTFESVAAVTFSFLATGLPRIILFTINPEHLSYYFKLAVIWFFYSNGIFNVLVFSYKLKPLRAVTRKMFADIFEFLRGNRIHIGVT